MLELFKKIFGSKWFRLIFSVVLIYFAFKKVDVMKLFKEIREIPIWFVLLNILVSFLSIVIISARWSLLLFPNIRFKTVLTFTRASFLASFYSLFFSTAAVGDVAKWLVIDSKYPNTSKTKILGSVVLDRFIGFTIFMVMGLISCLLGRKIGLIIPVYVFYLFLVLALICLLICVLIYFFDVSKLLPKFKVFRKLDEAFDLFKGKNREQMTKCLLISMVSEFLWMCQIWFINWKFGIGIDFLSIFIFVPIIAVILILPISIGGFGPREGLYLYFFSSFGNPEGVLLMSTFLGILGVINALFGGLLLLFNRDIKEKIKI